MHRCPKYGVVLAIWHKIKKGEFDRDEVREVTGRDWVSVINSWLVNGELGDPWYATIAKEIYDAYEE